MRYVVTLNYPNVPTLNGEYRFTRLSSALEFARDWKNGRICKATVHNFDPKTV